MGSLNSGELPIAFAEGFGQWKFGDPVNEIRPKFKHGFDSQVRRRGSVVSLGSPLQQAPCGGCGGSGRRRKSAAYKSQGASKGGKTCAKKKRLNESDRA